MELLLLILHIGVSLFLIFVVLLQSGQAADLAGAFGGGGSQTALGMRGAATLLQKMTTAAAVIFMLTSLFLGIVGRSESSLLERLEDQPAATQPAETGTQGGSSGSSEGGSGDQQEEGGRGPGGGQQDGPGSPEAGGPGS